MCEIDTGNNFPHCYGSHMVQTKRQRRCHWHWHSGIFIGDIGQPSAEAPQPRLRRICTRERIKCFPFNLSPLADKYNFYWSYQEV